MKTPRKSGFTLIETLTTVAVIAVIGSIAYLTLGTVTSDLREGKLKSDVATLNRGIQVYLANGGSLEGLENPKQVLRSLRKVADSELAERMPGLSSSMIDSRTWVNMQTNQEARSQELRAYWDPAGAKFYLANSGERGIREFYLDDTQGEKRERSEGRTSTMLFAAEDGWVWDYQERSLPDREIPTLVNTVAVSLSGVPTGGSPGLPNYVAAPKGFLQAPTYSLPGGTYSISNFDLAIELINPNPAGTSVMYYGINGGPLSQYTGPVNLQPGAILDAQAIAIDEAFLDSAKVSQGYHAEVVTLAPPVIITDRDTFGLFFGYDVEVNLTNPNDPSVSAVRYRINGGDWQMYSGPFVLNRDQFSEGAIIEAQSIPVDSEYYRSSTVSSRQLGFVSLDLTGNTTAGFHDPTGPSSMETNLSPGMSLSYFEWGNDDSSGHTKSWMQFDGRSFADVAAGERFQVGNLTYYNGTIRSNSGARTVDLTIDLDLDINGNIFHPSFEFTFELINTPNNNDSNNPWTAADYVKLEDPRSSRTLVINDYEYEFRLDFGETSADGFSHFDEFHVLEERDASVAVYGTFVRIGPVATPEPEAPESGGGLLSDIIEVVEETVEEVEDVVYQRDGYIDIEEAVDDLKDLARNRREVAEDAADEAEEAEYRARRAAQRAIEDADDDDEEDAEEEMERAERYAQRAEEEAAIALTAATEAEEAATEAEVLASWDAGAEDDAERARRYANDAAEYAERAQEAAVAARDWFLIAQAAYESIN